MAVKSRVKKVKGASSNGSAKYIRVSGRYGNKVHLASCGLVRNAAKGATAPAARIMPHDARCSRCTGKAK